MTPEANETRYSAIFQLVAHSADRRAAKGLLQRALQPWSAGYERYWQPDYGWSAQFYFQASVEEFEAACRAVRELALAEGWTGMPCEAVLAKGH
jgi:hypothetical protein